MGSILVRENMAEDHSKRKPLPLAKWLILVGALVMLVAPALKGWRLYRSATSLQSNIESLQTHAAGGLSNLDPLFLEEQILGIRADAISLNSELQPMLPLIQRLTWLPRVGDLVPVMPELLRLLDNGTLVAADLGVNMLPIIQILQDPTGNIESKVPEILKVIDDADQSLERTGLIWPTLKSDLETVLDNPAAREAMPWQVRQLLPTIEPLLPLVEKGIEGARILPEVAALNGRRAYLIVGQNSDELRSTGGFLSMTMAVGIEDGQLKGNHISDANVVDNYLEKPYGDPPAAMREFIGIDLFLFRDSNYWPDFPTSGRKMMDFYTYGTGLELDGIAAVDIRFIGRLIGAVGPITVPESDIVLTADNTLEILEQAWSQGLDIGGVSRKDFLGNIAAGIISHIQSDGFDPDIATLAQILDESIRDKSLQIFIDSAEEKAAFAKLGINGQVSYRAGEDVLLLSANNVGVNKSNRWVESTLSYEVVLHEDTSADAKLVSSWTNLASPTEENQSCPLSNFSYRPGEQYTTMTQACNWNHLRIYTPLDTQLIASGKYPIENNQMKSGLDWAGETRLVENDLSGFTIFENLLLIPTGETKDFEMNYKINSVVQPTDFDQSIYRLNLIRQAGVYPYPPTEIKIVLPPNSVVVSTSHTPNKISGNTLSFSTILKENQQIEVVYQSASQSQ